MYIHSRRKSLAGGEVRAWTPPILFEHKDTNVLALADSAALLEPSHFPTMTIYFEGVLPHSSSSPFKGQHAFGGCPHVYKLKYFAPAQLHVVLNNVRFQLPGGQKW